MRTLAYLVGMLIGWLASQAPSEGQTVCVGGACYQTPQALAPIQLRVPDREIRLSIPGPQITVQQQAPSVSLLDSGCYGGAYSSRQSYYAPRYAPEIRLGSALELGTYTPVYAGGYGYTGGYAIEEPIRDPYYLSPRQGIVDSRTRYRMFRAGINRGADIASYGRDQFDVRHRSLLQRVFW